jgi:uncharacterized Zn finger protein (UPF0148 family)
MDLEFHCPNCGAPLDPPAGSEKSIRCPFCNSSIIIPMELRNKNLNIDLFPHEVDKRLNQELSKNLSQIITLVKSGNKEEAITIFREQFDTSRIQAEKVINQIEKNQILEINQVINSLSQSEKPMPNFHNVETRIGIPNQKRIRSKLSILIIVIFGISILILIAGFFAVSTLPGAFLHEFWLKNDPAGDLKLITSFDQGTNGTKLVSVPDLVTVDQNGNIFISEYQTGIIQQFDSDGNFISQWDLGDGKVYIRSLDIDQKGILYIAIDRNILRIDTNTGSLIEPVPNPNNFFFDDFIVLSDNSFGIIDSKDNLARLDSDGNIIWIIEDAIYSIVDEKSLGGKLAIDGNNNFYLAGDFVESVFVFSYDGKYLNKFGSEGDGEGQFTGIESITIDQTGRILINDWGSLEIFLPDGRWEKAIQLPNQTMDLDYSMNNHLYVVTREPKVYIFSLNE